MSYKILLAKIHSCRQLKKELSLWKDVRPVTGQLRATYMRKTHYMYLPGRPNVNLCPAYFVPVFFPFVSEGFSISDVQQVSLAVKKSE
jgi:hypothetical protein